MSPEEQNKLMCVVSMVHDHFAPKIPKDDWWTTLPYVQPPPTTPITLTVQDPTQLEAIRKEVAALTKIVLDFRAAVEAAKKVDALTAQPDCVDPDKAKLEARVAELEKRLDQIGKAFLSGHP